MRAHLARNARRALLQHLRSPSCALYAAPARRRPVYLPIARRTCHRAFLEGIFKKAPREVRQPEFEPGWMQIMVWRSRMLDNLRPPSRSELIKAWRSFFKSKMNTKLPLNGTQAIQCQRLLAYLLQPSEESAKDAQLTYKDANKALDALRSLRPRERTQNHSNFAKSLYAALSSGELADAKTGEMDKLMLWGRFVKTLSVYNNAKEAYQMLRDNWDDVLKKDEIGLVTSVAFGLSRDGHENELVELAKHAEEAGISYNKSLQRAVTEFFAKRDRIPETQHWFEKIPDRGVRSAELYPVIAEFAARNNLHDWAAPFFVELGESKPAKEYWDSLLESILLMGKGLQEVEHLVQHMKHGEETVKADTATINYLLRAAVELKDPLLAEDVLNLGAENGLGVDGETYLIQMRLRLDGGYLPGVRSAYRKVSQLEPWQAKHTLWWEFSDLLNRYLDILCAQKQPDLKLVAELTEAAEEGQVQLEPNTVASLCVRLLENEQHFDVMDVLSVHAFQFSAEEREIIQDAFTKFCLDPETSTNRAWTCYQLLRQFFQDLSVEHRVELMAGFFNRNRPDMASHVFGHMRQHRNRDYHPTLEHYISFFEGLGQHPDSEALEMVRNMLKMDTSVRPNTRLYTSLIIAHGSCDKSLQALDFWQEIIASQEGPSYASLEAVFWAMERKPGGAKTARQIWKRIESLDVEVTPEVYNAYIGAVAGSGEEAEARTLITRMGALVGAEPSAMTLGVAFNALPGQQLQENFQGWAKTRYPDAWTELEKKGRRVTALSLCNFKLNRILRA